MAEVQTETETEQVLTGGQQKQVLTGGQQVLPFYLVCDESASMLTNGGIDAINNSLPELHDAVASDPLVNDKTRISMIAFSDDAELLVPLTPAADIENLPGVAERGATNYKAAFELLQSQISSDIASLKSNGYQVLRPAVFFISDGEPTYDGWQQSHKNLTDKSSNPHAPNIIAFGVDQAEAQTMAQVGTVACFLAEDNANPGAALKEIIKTIADSIVQSGTSPTPTLIIPPAPDGTTSIPLEPMD